MNGLIPLCVVAETLGLRPSYVRKIAADQGRPVSERRYPLATHERFPPFVHDGNSKKYFVPAATWAAHLRWRGRVWMQPMN